VINLVQPGVVFVTGAGMSGKGGEVFLPGCSLRGWSTRFASSFLGLGGEAFGAFVLMREVRFYTLFDEHSMVVGCVC